MPKPYTPNDKWSKRAAAEGYRARSVYKLMELDERFHLFSDGMKVLDLGAAPGSWLQYASAAVGPRGKVLGLDLTEIKPVKDNVRTAMIDVTDLRKIEIFFKEQKIDRVNLVLSDMAPLTSGIHDIDQWRSVELAEAACAVALQFLKPGGFCVIKIFRGVDFDPFLVKVRTMFSLVKIVTVEATRDRSREVYLVMKK